jgi:recombination protein RecA
MPRVRLDDDEEVTAVESGGSYFADQKSDLEFIHSGAAVLDCTLGGGWALQRIGNIVGDFSAGKSLLAIEACANFHRQFPKGLMYYRESESAFNEAYAAALGMPVDKIAFVNPDEFVTVEDFYEDLTKCIEEARRRDAHALYVLDSLDALSDKAEQKEAFDAGTYGTGKAKMMGKLLRKCVGDITRARMSLLVISQTRDKIGSMFAAKTRSGGRALDFYASQVLWLHKIDDLTRTLTRNGKKITRVTGVQIRAKCQKNKIALPYRQCDFTISFGQGINSLTSSLDWLEDVGRIEEVYGVQRATVNKRIAAMDDAEYWEETSRIDAEVVRIWKEVEGEFLQNTRRKYQDAS